MSKAGTHTREILDTWREQGADRLNPLRFHFIEALGRRAAGHDGEARRLLEDRLSKLIQAYVDDLDIAVSSTAHVDSATTPRAPARGVLGELIDHIASHAATRGVDFVALGATPRTSAFPQLGVLDEFRSLWSEIRTDSQVRQSLEQVPANAGPLNSSSLVHRSLTLMRELSPGYLQQFLAYVDTLAWMEQLGDSGVLAVKEGRQGRSVKKRTRAKPRGHRE